MYLKINIKWLQSPKCQNDNAYVDGWRCCRQAHCCPLEITKRPSFKNYEKAPQARLYNLKTKIYKGMSLRLNK